MTRTLLITAAMMAALARAGSGAVRPHAPAAGDWHVEVAEESDQGLTLRVQVLPDPGSGWLLSKNAVEPETPPLTLGGWIALPAAAMPLVEVLEQAWSGGRAPETPCWTLSEPVRWLGQTACSFSVDPLDEASSAHLTELALRISFRTGGPATPAASRSLAQAERAARLVVNPGLVERREAGRTGELPLGRYLVVGKEASLGYLEDWAAWRRRQGYEVTVRSSESLGVWDNDWTPIRDEAQDLLATDGLDYLFIVGDMNISGNNYHVPGDLVPGGQYAEYQWGRNIVTDHSLAMLEGDDYFSDVVVGRFPADNATQVSLMANRVLLYEQTPLVSDAGWPGRALMVFDVSGAGSRRETSLAIRQHLFEAGFAEVDTIRNDRYLDPQSPTLVVNALNDGRAFVNYRGFGYRYSWNGPLFGVDQMGQLSNYGRWPLVTSMVCGGGDFSNTQYDPCLGEAFVRAGTVTEPTGAIAFIGPSEEDTHSQWNNCLDLGLYQGLLREGIRDVGTLLERGKAELWTCFPNDREGVWYDPGSPSQATNVRFYFYCYNVLGDPGTRVRMGEQRVAEAVDWRAPAAGSTHLSLSMADEGGAPAADLWVCLSDADDARVALGRTDATGRVELDFPPLAAGAHHVVAHGDDWVPFIRDFTAASQPSHTVLEDWRVANQDTLLSAGDVFTLSLSLREAGSAGSAAGRQLHVEAVDEGLVVTQGMVELPELAPGQAVDAEGLELQVTASVVDGQALPMLLRLTEADGTTLWARRLEAAAVGARPEIDLLTLDPARPAAGDEVAVLLGLRNAGPVVLDADSCRLFPASAACDMLDQDAPFAALEPGAMAEAGPFRLRLAEGIPDGARLNLDLVFFRADRSTAARLPLTIEVGQVGPTDPVGPDDHGYLIFHQNDDGGQAPDFAYHDIAQEGTEIGLDDEGVAFNEEGIDGVSRVVALPFPFTFYGQAYDTITVCSNGWIAMGDQRDHILGINTPIPAAQGPNAMVAVFWTDLYNYYANFRFGHCYRHHDEAEHTFTIQWDNFQHAGHPYQDNWFQAVLRDPAWWPTPTGDGEILLQYENIVTTFGDLRFTVGVERPDQMAGLQYTFNGEYPDAGQAVTSGTALLITTAPRFEALDLSPVARPGGLAFQPAAPNPFNPETVITLDASRAEPLRLSVYNLRGELVRRLHDGPVAAGRRNFRLDARGLAGGLYLVEARQAGRSAVQRVLYLP